MARMASDVLIYRGNMTTTIPLLGNAVVDLNILFDADSRKATFQIVTNGCIWKVSDINEAIRLFDDVTKRSWAKSLEQLEQRGSRPTYNVVDRMINAPRRVYSAGQWKFMREIDKWTAPNEQQDD